MSNKRVNRTEPWDLPFTMADRRGHKGLVPAAARHSLSGVPRILMGVLFLTFLLASYLWQDHHIIWAEGMLLGVGIGAVHLLSWTVILETLTADAHRPVDARLLQGVLLKALFVYGPVIWLIGEPPAMGLFAVIGFTVVLLAAAADRALARPTVLAAVSVVVLLLSGQGRALARSNVEPTGPEKSLAARRPQSSQADANRPQTRNDGAPAAENDTSSKKQKQPPPEKKHVELPTLGRWAKALFPNSPVVKILANPHVERALWTFFVTFSLALLFVWVARRAAFHPGRLQAGMELAIRWIVDLLSTIFPEPEAKRFLPFIGGLFIYVLAVNLSGLIPFAAPGSTFIAMTAGLAACTFLTVQYMAFTKLGPLRYLYHLAGEPTDKVTWAMSPLMVVLHIVEELAKPITLSVRLFGNVFAEHTLLAVMALLGIGSLSMIHSPVGLPFELPFMFLALLTGSIQALVFAILSAVYIALVLPDED